MTQAERTSIENGIWLCRNHAGTIDEDEVAYPADRLRAMRLRHEMSRSFDPNAADSSELHDIIALGPDIIGVGYFSGASTAGWKVRLKHFIKGDSLGLFGWASDFSRLPFEERYVLLNELGEGRILSMAPTVE